MCQETRRQAQGQTIKYSSPSFYTLFLVYYVTNSSRLSTLSMYSTWAVIWIQTVLLRSRTHLESDYILIPVWIWNIWMKTQRTEIKHGVTYLHMWRREHVWDTAGAFTSATHCQAMNISLTPEWERKRLREMRSYERSHNYRTPLHN